MAQMAKKQQKQQHSKNKLRNKKGKNPQQLIQQQGKQKPTKTTQNKINYNKEFKHEDQQRIPTSQNKADLEKLLITSHQQIHKDPQESQRTGAPTS